VHSRFFQRVPGSPAAAAGSHPPPRSLNTGETPDPDLIIHSWLPGSVLSLPRARRPGAPRARAPSASTSSSPIIRHASCDRPKTTSVTFNSREVRGSQGRVSAAMLEARYGSGGVGAYLTAQRRSSARRADGRSVGRVFLCPCSQPHRLGAAVSRSFPQPFLGR
jgi:hypothetical protein